MDFQTFHKYNRLVRRGIVKPLACKQCTGALSVELGPGDNPVLKCYYCQSTTTPGLSLYSDVAAVVKEHFYHHENTNTFNGPV